MADEERVFSTTGVFALGLIIFLDVAVGGLALSLGASSAQVVLYVGANVVFLSWLIIAWRRLTPTAVSFLIAGGITVGSGLGLDYVAATLLVYAGVAEWWLALALRLMLASVTAASAFFLIRQGILRGGRAQSALLALSVVGVGLSLCFLWLPIGLTVLILGLVFPRQLLAAKVCLVAVWILAFVEAAAANLWPAFPSYSRPLLNLIVSVPIYAYVLLALPLVYFFLPRVWRAVWGARSSMANGWRLFGESLMGKVGLGIVLGFVLMGVFAPYLAPFPHDEWSTLQNAPPSWEHPLGTNYYGQDLLSRIIWASRISLVVGFAAAAIAVGIGTTIGMVSGYIGGLLDAVLMRITDLFLSMPALPLMLILAALFGKGLMNIIFALAALSWTGTARMVRSQTLSLKERPITEASKAVGSSDSHILFRHILPNTLPLILANMVLGVVDAVLGEAGLSFLGFGVPFGAPSWGIILYFARIKGAILNNMWWWLIPPGVLIMLLVLGFAFMSHAIDRIVNPRLRRRRR